MGRLANTNTLLASSWLPRCRSREYEPYEHEERGATSTLHPAPSNLLTAHASTPIRSVSLAEVSARHDQVIDLQNHAHRLSGQPDGGHTDQKGLEHALLPNVRDGAFADVNARGGLPIRVALS